MIEEENGTRPTALERAQDLIEGGIGQDRKADMLARIYYQLDEQLAELRMIKTGQGFNEEDPVPGNGHPSGWQLNNKDGEYTNEERFPGLKFDNFRQTIARLEEGITDLYEENDGIWKLVEDKLPEIRKEMEQRRKQAIASQGQA